MVEFLVNETDADVPLVAAGVDAGDGDTHVVGALVGAGVVTNNVSERAAQTLINAARCAAQRGPIAVVCDDGGGGNSRVHNG